jgi:8-oxo-dGTP diphosphatase
VAAEPGRRVLWTTNDFEFLPKPNEISVVLDGTMPPVELITSAGALAFDGDRFLLPRLTSHDWDLVGGHVEPGESPEETMRREVYEETGARLGPARVFAHTLWRVCGPKPTGYRYPHPDSYMLFYWARVVALDPFVASEESSERGLFPPEEARKLACVQKHLALYEAALAWALSGPPDS